MLNLSSLIEPDPTLSTLPPEVAKGMFILAGLCGGGFILLGSIFSAIWGWHIWNRDIRGRDILEENWRYNRQETQKTWKTFLSQMESLLAAGFPSSEKTFQTRLREYTLSAMKILDGRQRTIVLHFLADTGLLNGEHAMDLRGADLRACNFEGLDLTGIDLSGTNLLGAAISQDQMSSVKSLAGATLPGSLISVHSKVLKQTASRTWMVISILFLLLGSAACLSWGTLGGISVIIVRGIVMPEFYDTMILSEKLLGVIFVFIPGIVMGAAGIGLWVQYLQARNDDRKLQSRQEKLQEELLREATDHLKARLSTFDSGKLPDREARALVRVYSLFTMHELSTDYQARLLHFLYDHALIKGHSPIIRLKGTSLQGINLAEMNFSGISLAGVKLTHANLYKADLSQADLQATNLQAADLREANLQDADLSHANLQKTRLHRANLTRVNMEGANLNQANLWGANLESANVSQQQLTQARTGSDHGSESGSREVNR